MAKQQKKKDIDELIEQMDQHNKEMTELSIQEHTDKIPQQPHDDLVAVLKEKLDIRKIFRDTDIDNSQLEEFIQRENNPLFTSMPTTLVVNVKRSKVDEEAM